MGVVHRRIAEALHIYQTPNTTNLDCGQTSDSSIWFPLLTCPPPLSHLFYALLYAYYVILIYIVTLSPIPIVALYKSPFLKFCTTDEDLRIEMSCIE